jgi:hypothetical protein
MNAVSYSVIEPIARRIRQARVQHSWGKPAALCPFDPAVNA